MKDDSGDDDHGSDDSDDDDHGSSDWATDRRGKGKKSGKSDKHSWKHKSWDDEHGWKGTSWGDGAGSWGGKDDSKDKGDEGQGRRQGRLPSAAAATATAAAAPAAPPPPPSKVCPTGLPFSFTIGDVDETKFAGDYTSTSAGVSVEPSGDVFWSGVKFTISNVNTTANTFDWSASKNTLPLGVDAVIVRGAQSAMSFAFSPEVSAATGMHAPFVGQQAGQELDRQGGQLEAQGQARQVRQARQERQARQARQAPQASGKKAQDAQAQAQEAQAEAAIPADQERDVLPRHRGRSRRRSRRRRRPSPRRRRRRRP